MRPSACCGRRGRSCHVNGTGTCSPRCELVAPDAAHTRAVLHRPSACHMSCRDRWGQSRRANGTRRVERDAGLAANATRRIRRSLGPAGAGSTPAEAGGADALRERQVDMPGCDRFAPEAACTRGARHRLSACSSRWGLPRRARGTGRALLTANASRRMRPTLGPSGAGLQPAVVGGGSRVARAARGRARLAATATQRTCTRLC